MTTERLYELIKAWRESCASEQMEFTVYEMDKTLKSLEADMRMSAAKKSGTKSIVTAANRIIKSAMNRPHEALHGMFENKTDNGETVYCVCDSYHAVRFKEKPFLPEIDSKYRAYVMNITPICKMPENSTKIELPCIADLKVFVKTHKVVENKVKTLEPYCLNTELNLWVNPQYLINMMECIPDCEVYASNSVSTIYFKGENADGVLCPVNPARIRKN